MDYEKAKSLCRLPHPNQRWGCLSFAQHGDDLMLVNLMELLGIRFPSWLDLGAHHPFNISNTALLYERGGRGVNVEANPLLLSEFRKHRPEDKNVCVGVGLESGYQTFYKFSDTSGLNTFCPKEIIKLAQKGIIHKEEISLPVSTVQQIVDEYCNRVWPDILLTDLEGLDFPVLESLDFKGRGPKVVVAETRRGESSQMKYMMAEKGYVPYCRMWENLFFVQSDFSYLVL